MSRDLYDFYNYHYYYQKLLCSGIQLPYTAKNIRRFYGKITGNQLPVHFPFPFSLWAPVNIFRNQAQYGSKKTCIAFGHIALKP